MDYLPITYMCTCGLLMLPACMAVYQDVHIYPHVSTFFSNWQIPHPPYISLLETVRSKNCKGWW